MQCEDYLQRLHEDEGFPATSMRVTHTIGPRTPLASREPVFFERLLTGRPIFVPADGFPFVHLVHIDDVARCIASAGERETALGRAYNVSGDEVTSVLGCMQLMAKVAGVEPNIVHVPLDVARHARPPLCIGVKRSWAARSSRTTRRRPTSDGDRSSVSKLRTAIRSRGGRRVGATGYDYDFSGDDAVLEALGRTL